VLDVVGDVVEAVIAELAVAQARDSVIFVKALLRPGGRLDMPFDELQPECRRHLTGELRLAGAGFALDQQGALQRDRGVDRHHQIPVGDISRGAFEKHFFSCPCGGTVRSHAHARKL